MKKYTVRMQAAGNRYSNVLSAFQHTTHAEGFQGLYHGVGPNVQRAMLLTATQLPSYDFFKQIILEKNLVQEGMICHFISAMFAGLMCATTTSPIDLVKV